MIARHGISNRTWTPKPCPNRRTPALDLYPNRTKPWILMATEDGPAKTLHPKNQKTQNQKTPTTTTQKNIHAHAHRKPTHTTKQQHPTQHQPKNQNTPTWEKNNPFCPKPNQSQKPNRNQPATPPPTNHTTKHTEPYMIHRTT